MLLFVVISSLWISSVYSVSCNEANGDTQANCESIAGCVYNADDSSCNEATTTTTTTAAAGTDTTEEIDCDNSDLNEWRVNYIGKSTQFRIYDPCDSKFIKFKMEDLTEYDGDTDKKTNNKETSFASSKNWEWGENSGTVQQYQGNDAIYNSFEADTLTKNDAVFTLETLFFMEQAEICCDDEGNNMTLTQNSLKFNVNITNWEYAQSQNYLVLCIGIMTNKAGDIDNDPDTKTFYLGQFEIDNSENATCVDSNGDETNINVDIERGGNGNNHLDLCYTFDSCDGDIIYDPILQIGNKSDSKNIFIVFITISIISFFSV